MIIPSAVLSALAPLFFSMWLYDDNNKTRLLLFTGSSILLGIAAVFVVGGVYIMILDLLIMGYCCVITWNYVKNNKHHNRGSGIPTPPLTFSNLAKLQTSLGTKGYGSSYNSVDVSNAHGSRIQGNGQCSPIRIHVNSTGNGHTSPVKIPGNSENLV